MGVFSKSVRLRICRIWYRLVSSPNRLRTIATSTYTDTAIQIWVFTAFSLVPVESLHPQVLFDPFEEQFHLPALFVDLGDGQRGKHEVVGQELQPLAGFSIAVAHLS